MTEVLYTGAFRFPDGDAAALRVYSLAKLFERCGAKVCFAGWEGEVARTYQYKGHICYSQAEFRVRRKGILSRVLGFVFRGRKTVAWLMRHKRFDAVVLYNPPAFFALCMMALAKIYKFKLILDSTEWYESDHLPGGRFGLAAIENEIRMKIIYPLFSNAICISHFLKEHLNGVTNSIWLPPLLLNEIPVANFSSNSLDTLRFFYAGDMGLKDDLTRFVGALEYLEMQSKRRIELHVAGSSEVFFYNVLNAAGLETDFCRSRIYFYGRLPREEILKLYANFHFSVFFRQNKRYALAGFPTKSVESLSRGCPIITNSVGDLASILIDGENSYVLGEGASLGRLAAQLAELTPEVYRQMRSAAFEVYEKNFTVTANISKFQIFYSRIGILAKRDTRQ